MDEVTTPRRQFWEGFGLAWFLLFLIVLIFFAAFLTWSDWGTNGPTDKWTDIPMYLLIGCGLSQWVYVVPCYLFFSRRKMPYLAKGVLYGAASILGANLLFFFWWWFR